MSETVPKDYIIGFIIFTLIITAGMTYMATYASDDADFIDNAELNSFNESFWRYNQLNTKVGELTNSTRTSDADSWETLGVLDTLIKTSWYALTTMFSGFDMITEALQALSTFFGVPSWAVGSVIMLIMVMFAFSIFAALFQRNI